MKNREYETFMLLNAPGFGPKVIYYVYECFKKNNLSINSLFDLDTNRLSELLPEIGRGKFSRAGLSVFKTLDNDEVFESYQKIKAEQIHIIGLDDERYPRSVIEKMKQNAPPVLFCKGHLPLLNSKGISVVGSRDVSDLAIKITRRIAGRLAENGYTVTSGYAKGVDTNAHLGALENNGTTTMILSYGVNYLSIKKDIKQFNWEKNTLFVTQFMPYEKFSGSNAMMRNKLVCALSRAVIVISSGPERDKDGKMSGTFDAGKSALDMNIPLFVLDPELLGTSVPKGNYDLIKMGGIRLSNGNDLIDYLGAIQKDEPGPGPEMNKGEKVTSYQHETSEVKEPDAELDSTYKIILGVFNGFPLTANDILKKAKLDWSSKKLTAYLMKTGSVDKIKQGRTNLFIPKNNHQKPQPELF